MSESIGSWHTSTYSGGGACVEVSLDWRQVRVRDSKDPDGPVLTFTHPEWDAFVRGVFSGEFNLPVAHSH
jgi:hypothetical protein